MISAISKSIQAAFQRLIAPRVLSLWLLAGLAGVVMGPFETYSSLELRQRSLFWGTISASSVVLSSVIRDLRQILFPVVPDWLRETIHVISFTVVLTPAVYGLSLFYPLEILQGSVAYLKVTFFVFAVSGLFSALRLLTSHPELLVATPPVSSAKISYDAFGVQEAGQQSARQVAGVRTCRLYERLPSETSGVILHLSARDHFVDVELADSLISVKMRFCDAVAEMDNTEGFLTHRSHWVAKEAITSVLYDEGKMFFVLATGRHVPVSRSARLRLDAEGALEPFRTSVSL